MGDDRVTRDVKLHHISPLVYLRLCKRVTWGPPRVGGISPAGITATGLRIWRAIRTVNYHTRYVTCCASSTFFSFHRFSHPPPRCILPHCPKISSINRASPPVYVHICVYIYVCTRPVSLVGVGVRGEKKDSLRDGRCNEEKRRE